MRQSAHLDDDVEIQPLLSSDERRFMEGSLTADAFAESGNKEIVRQTVEEIADMRVRDTVRATKLFGAVASTVYLLTTVVVLVGSRVGPAIAAASTSVALLGFTSLVATYGRRHRL